MAAPTQAIPTGLHRSHRIDTTDRGSKIVRGVRAFKTGSFKDSMGTRNTWTSAHLDQMVYHFKMLRDEGILPDIPLRTDHSSRTDSVIGYLVDVYRDPVDPAFLAVDVEFTEPDAFSKYERGTYRSRSVEIGKYETNDGAEYYPVVLGLAFVDIPAVEGLHSKLSPTSYFSHVVYDQEEGTVDINDPKWPEAVAYAAWLQAANHAQAEADWTRAVEYAAWSQAAHYAQVEADAAAALAAAGQQEPAGAGQHRAPAPPAPAQYAFRVNGQVGITDPIAVQAHIDSLEGFRTEQTQQSRRDFVSSLVTDKKIAVTQQGTLTALALSMEQAQFEAFVESYKDAPALAIFANPAEAVGNGGMQHPAQQFGTLPGGPGQPSPEGRQYTRAETLRDQLSMHKMAGMSEDKIKALASYKEYETLCTAANQPIEY